MNERRWWLSNDRWGVAAVIALVGAAVAAFGRAWAEAAVFFLAAVALAIVTLRSRAR